MNLLSKDIKVFPSTYRLRGAGQYLNENNVTNILMSLSNKDCFVIDYTNPIMKIIMFGYYFEFNTDPITSNLLTGSNKKVYAHILIQNPPKVGVDTTTDSNNIENNGVSAVLVAFDTTGSTTLDTIIADTTTEKGTFNGILFDTNENISTIPSNCRQYSLCILEIPAGSTTIRVPDSSWFRINSKTVFKGDTGTSNTGLNEIIDSKQNKLIADDDSGIVIDQPSNLLGTADISLNDDYLKTLNSMKETVGTVANPVYVNNGVVTKVTGNSGASLKNMGGYYLEQSALISTGSLSSDGFRIYASDKSPTTFEDIGVNGDIWLKYSK